MVQKILKLPETVINQISAGEVVENPASIVKELVENSLDAGANAIHVEIAGGGQELIRVEDDGCGMSREDALLSLERHATSKLKSIEDLQSLGTMGFRGEALAAIASVSQFELLTSDGMGTRVVAEGGRVVKVEPCARNRGTTMEIRSLFYNTPARKKFQKSASSCAAAVTKTMETIVLAHPEVAFSLKVHGKTTIKTRPASWKERIGEVVGALDHEVQYEGNGIAISGLVGAPAKAMINRSGQYLFINRRPIVSPLISRAVKEGFGTRIGEHEFPTFVLFLEIPADEVDINVHPQKREARFRDDGKIFRSFLQAVSSSFVAPVSFEEPISFTPPAPFSFMEQSLPSFSLAEEAPELEMQFAERVLGVFGSYLMLEREGLILVDLKAAHARVLFESMGKEKGTAQALMWPLEIDGCDEETALELNELGIECRLLGKVLVVDALPGMLDVGHFQSFFTIWKEGKKLVQATTRFCRGLKKSYSSDEAYQLWRALQKCTDRLYDPSGNAIWVEVKETDLERMLKDANR
jgi:DNA mismatch repair protein MutL